MNFADELASITAHLPGQLVERLAEYVQTRPGPSGLALSQAKDLAGTPAFRDACDRVWAAWRHTPDLPGSAVALGLRSAATATARQRRALAVEPVVTGPSSWHVPLRQTTGVLLELIREVSSELWLVSFAAYKVPEISEALTAAVQRGARVTMLLETASDSHGALSTDAAKAFKDLPSAVRFCFWPAEQRPILPHGSPSMHAKALLVDRKAAFVTSANLTGHALEHNLEMGVLVRGGDLAERMTRHLEALVDQHVLWVV